MTGNASNPSERPSHGPRRDRENRMSPNELEVAAMSQHAGIPGGTTDLHGRNLAQTVKELLHEGNVPTRDDPLARTV